MPAFLKKRSVQLALAVVLIAAGFLAWRALTAEPPRPAFEGARALAEVRQQVAFGPRAPGSAGHERARAYFTDTLRVLASGGVRPQRFTYPAAGDTARRQPGTNIIASFDPTPGEDAERPRVLLAAHYDTRARADEDPDASKRARPILGANDGASGVAVLLELARLFHRQPPSVGVDLVLFDLEDMGTPQSDTTGAQIPFALGARHFAQTLPNPDRYAFGILLDMVCDRNLRIPKEGHSRRRAPEVIDKVWAAARAVGAGSFVEQRGPAITDDHVPLLDAGVPMVDLIHAPFPWYWHTTMDTPDQCSAERLEEVGEVVAEVVYRE